MRRALAQSTATSARSPMSSGSSRSTSSRPMKSNSAGMLAEPDRYMSASLPSSRRPSAIASIEPSASPSGFSCATTRKRSFEVSAASTPSRSVDAFSFVSCVIRSAPRRYLVNELRHADAAFHGRIVFKREVWSPLEPELTSDTALQVGMGGFEPLERRLLLALVAEHRDVDLALAQVAGDRDAGDRDHPDPRVLQLAHRLGDDGPNSLVDTSHAFAHVTNRTQSSGDVSTMRVDTRSHSCP